MSDLLSALTRSMPCKTIQVNGADYLRRYWAGETDTHDIWVHNFLTADGDRYLHNHPWKAKALVLSGGYLEETPEGEGWIVAPDEISRGEIFSILQGNDFALRGFDAREINPGTWHRIKEVIPGTWTVLFVEKWRAPHWYFDHDGELVPERSSERDWYKKYGPLTEAGERN